jgi:transposase
MRETVTLNRKEQRRLLVMNRVIGGQMTGVGGAELLEVSIRHFRRLLAAYREEGAAALAHGNRGRKPSHALGEELKGRVVELAQGRYGGLNHQHLSEELRGEGIRLSRGSVRRILLAAGMVSPRTRRAPKHRIRRQRAPQEGMFVQIDGSPHDWLEGRGPRLNLIAGIDDATGKMPYALFRAVEDAQGYFSLLEEIVATHGRPLALYHDRHEIFRHTAKQPLSVEEELAGKQDRPTQFGRLLEELGIASIAARSPQAKGRVERLFGTLQDRLVSQLRLAGASSLGEANRVLRDYLPQFNERFGVPAQVEGCAYRPVEEGFRAERAFCFKYERKVGKDNTVRFGEHRLQLMPGKGRGSFAGKAVEVHERMDGSIAVCRQGEVLGFKAAPREAPELRTRKRRRTPEQEMTLQPGEKAQGRAEPAVVGVEVVDKRAGSAEAVHLSTARPAPNHPWRRYSTN